jgi:hypothetical protein
MNGYGDNGQRKVWSSGGYTHCTSQLRIFIGVRPGVWCQITANELTLALNCIRTSFWGDNVVHIAAA